MTSYSFPENNRGPTAAEPPAVLSVHGLSKQYGAAGASRLVLSRIDLEVHGCRFVCIVGPSGAGKTTLLRCMSGLLQPTSGEVRLSGDPVRKPAPGIAVVFQDYSRSLLPWMSVRKNVTLPLRSAGIGSAARRSRAEEALAAVGLPRTCFDQYPWQLSGGMQQRVAIARALGYSPTVLLMDEPFASVDAQARADLEDLILGVRNELGVTVILVTHDIDEAVYLGDEVVVLSGSPTTVRECIPIGFGRDRDQLETKSTKEFAQARTRVLRLIRGEDPGHAVSE